MGSSKIYLIRKQNTMSEIIGFTKLHFDSTQEHSALFLQKCNTLLNFVHTSRSVTTSDFFSWRRNVLHMLLWFSDHKHLHLIYSSLNLKISNWGILTILNFWSSLWFRKPSCPDDILYFQNFETNEMYKLKHFPETNFLQTLLW